MIQNLAERKFGSSHRQNEKKNKKIKNKQCREHEQCSAHGCVVKKSRRLVNKQAPSISAFAPLTVTSSIFSCETL